MASNSNEINLSITFSPPALMACAVMPKKRESMKLDDIGKLSEGTFQARHENSYRPSKRASAFFEEDLRSSCEMIFKTHASCTRLGIRRLKRRMRALSSSLFASSIYVRMADLRRVLTSSRERPQTAIS
jgi:hypothetical protein